MKNDGGPAFPSPTANHDQHGQLSVRDYFATHALASIIVAAKGIGNPVPQPEHLVFAAYDFADMMLKERAKL